MNPRKPARQALAACAFLCFCVCQASAQAKPPESTSKVKKVLLYNKIGGWVAMDGVAAVKETFSKLAVAKGFELVQSASDSVLTPDFLRHFQVIVWNNNTNGGGSVPSASARQAILDYLSQGGGWILIHNAGDHQRSWPGLDEAMGTTFFKTGMQGQAEVVLDSAGKSHRELRWMLDGFPETFSLVDRWLSFWNTVRPLPGVTVVATSRSIPGIAGILVPPEDKSGDNVYLWAREIGKGRLFYTALGFGMNKLMEQQDSIVPRLYWEHLRYAAGDYQNGCTSPGSPGFDPAARVHVEAMCSATGLVAPSARAELRVSRGSLSMRPIPGGPLLVRVRDLRGALVRERAFPAGSREKFLDGALGSGVYHVEIRGAAETVPRRIIMP